MKARLSPSLQGCCGPSRPLHLLPVPEGGVRGLTPQRIDVRCLPRCSRRQLRAQLLVQQLQLAPALPGLAQGPLDLLHPLAQLPVTLLQGRHLLLQLLDVVLFLKQGLLHGGAQELGTDIRRQGQRGESQVLDDPTLPASQLRPQVHTALLLLSISGFLGGSCFLKDILNICHSKNELLGKRGAHNKSTQ